MLLIPLSLLLRRSYPFPLLRPNPTHTLLALLYYSPSLAGSITFFSRSFHRTLDVTLSAVTSYRLYSSSHRPFDFRNPCPIDFTEFERPSNDNDELGTARLVERARESQGLSSKTQALGLLDNSGVEPNEFFVCRAMWALRDGWESALLVFKWGVKRGCTTVTPLALAVWVLGSHQNFNLAWDLIRESYRSALDTRTSMLVMIERYAAANYPHKAIKTLHLMDKLKPSPDRQAFYTLLSALSNNGDVEDAEEVMLNSRNLFPLETEGFNIILYGWCCVTADVLEAKRVWREMSRCCITPDAVSYTLMISCFSSVGNLFDSLRLYDDMKRKGWAPDMEVYNSLIYVLARENCFDDAHNILKKIKETGLQPDSTSYNSLIYPLCEAGKLQEARKLLDAMIADDIRPTVDTYHAFLECADVESSLQVLDQMKKAGLGPNSHSFLLLFDKFFRLKQPENALKIWVEMENCGVERDSAHYASLVQGLAKYGFLAKAREIHTEMASKPILQDPKLKRLVRERPRNSRLPRLQRMMNTGMVDTDGILDYHRRRSVNGSRRHGYKIWKKQSTWENKVDLGFRRVRFQRIHP